MKVIFAQSSSAIHFTSFGSLPEDDWCCRDLRSPCLSSSSSWASGRAAQAPLGGKASLPLAPGWHSQSTGNHHHCGSRTAHLCLRVMRCHILELTMPHSTHLGTETPFAGVRISLHDHSLDLCHNTMITGRNHCCGHQGNGCKSRQRVH